MEDKLIDYLEDQLSSAQRQEVEAALAESAELQSKLEELKIVLQGLEEVPVLQPSAQLQRKFDRYLRTIIEEENPGHQTTSTAKVVTFSRQKTMWFQMAAASVILLLGVLIGLNISKENKIDDLKQQVAELVEKKSVSQRIKGVNVSYHLAKADSEIIKVLIELLNEDESTNVRLAALEALSRWTNENSVREALIGALRTQKDPAIQIDLINLLVDIKEKRALPNMENLINDTETPEFIKGETRMGIFKLRSI